MIRTFRHAAIVVTDMERALGFYRDLLGLKIVLDAEREGEFFDKLLAMPGVRMRVAMLEAPDAGRIELFEFLSHPAWVRHPEEKREAGCWHVALSVADIDRTYQRLLERGVRFNCPPQVSPDGYGKVTYCYDPDGATIELVQILNPDKDPYQG